MHADWLIPDWPAPSNVRAVLTTRAGGTSKTPWDSMNLGEHVGDSADAVAINRAVLQKNAGMHAVFMKQVHAGAVLAIDAGTGDGLVADACITTQAGVACTIMVADCLPVLLADEEGSVVAAAHAGWRGLSGAYSGGKTGVLESVCGEFQAARSIPRAAAATKIIAWMGPCIGPSAFEVGPEVKAAFETSQADAGRFFKAGKPGKYLADLAGLARQRLQALGITNIHGNDSSDAWCTVLNPDKYFSHRRDAGVGAASNGFGTTGRMAACIWTT